VSTSTAFSIWASFPFAASPGAGQTTTSGTAPWRSMSSPLSIRYQPRNGIRRKPTSMIAVPPVLMTPPAVGTPTRWPRFSVLIAWLKISALLGAHPVCTQPSTCATAVYSPIPAEAVHYAIGHWVEDDPAVGDGAFSSAGKFGFYPWIAHDKAWWGIVARSAQNGAEQEGVASMKCGRRIRAAWVAGQ